MNLSSEFEDLLNEIFDEDLPGVTKATFNNGANEITGKLSREYIETEQVQGVKSTFLCSIKAAADLGTTDEILIDGSIFTAPYREREGIATVRLILSLVSNG